MNKKKSRERARDNIQVTKSGMKLFSFVNIRAKLGYSHKKGRDEEQNE